MTLRSRLLFGLGILVLTAVASSGWLVLSVARHELSNAQLTDARALGERVLRVLSFAANEAGKPLDQPEARARLRDVIGDLVARGLVREVSVVRDGVALVGRVDPDDAIGSVANGVVIRRTEDGLRLFGSIAGVRGDRAAVRIDLPGEDVIARAVGRAGWLVVLAALFCAGVVLLFGALFIENIVGAISALAQAARRVASSDLDVPALPIAAGSADELSGLAADFNAMTEALRRERALVSAQRDSLIANEKLVTVGRLAAGVAHEIGNPLAAILGFSDLLHADDEAQTRPMDPADRKDAIVRIRGEAQRIQRIIRELLDYSRPLAEEREPIELSAVIERTISLLRPQPRFRDVEVERQLPADLPPALASAARIEQILVNLFLNAADAMQGRGRVIVAAEAKDDRVELSVRDSGPGVPLADRDKIFEPFFSTKDPGAGTGLGLAVSQAIARALGGDLRLSDSQDAGARFVLSLPRATR